MSSHTSIKKKTVWKIPKNQIFHFLHHVGQFGSICTLRLILSKCVIKSEFLTEINKLMFIYNACTCRYYLIVFDIAISAILCQFLNILHSKRLKNTIGLEQNKQII